MFVIETGLQFEAYLTKTGGRHHRADWYSVSHSLERLDCVWFVSGSYLSMFFSRLVWGLCLSCKTWGANRNVSMRSRVIWKLPYWRNTSYVSTGRMSVLLFYVWSMEYKAELKLGCPYMYSVSFIPTGYEVVIVGSACVVCQKCTVVWYDPFQYLTQMTVCWEFNSSNIAYFHSLF